MSLLDQAVAQARTACSMSLSDDAITAGKAGADAGTVGCTIADAAGAVATGAVGFTVAATGATTGATTAGAAATGFAALGLTPLPLGVNNSRINVSLGCKVVLEPPSCSALL